MERSCGEETRRATRFMKSVAGDFSQALLSRPASKVERRSHAVVTEFPERGEFRGDGSPVPPIHKAEEAESLTKWMVDYQPWCSVKVDECLPIWSFRKECRSFCFRVLRVLSSTPPSEGDLDLFAWRSAESTEVLEDLDAGLQMRNFCCSL